MRIRKLKGNPFWPKDKLPPKVEKGKEGKDKGGEGK